MEFSLDMYNENLFIRNNQQFLFDDDVSHLQNEHLNFFDDNLGHSSLNGWSHPPILTAFSPHYHQNLISSIPFQNYSSLDWNLDSIQNPPVYKPPITEIPSTYPLMDINSYSSTDSFKECETSFMTYNTPIPKEPEGISDYFYDVQGNTVWDDVGHDYGFITSGQEINLDQILAQSQPFDFLGHKNINITNKKIINQFQDRVIIKNDQEKNKGMQVNKSISSKKANTIKWKWTRTEDRILMRMVELYGAKKWSMVSKMFQGRQGKQCRERWQNHLRPNIKKDNWSEEEDQILIEAHKLVGNKWAEIAKRLPRRSENTIKNHWNAAKRRIQMMKAKKTDENVHSLHNNTLENYIRYTTINHDPLKMTKDDDNDYEYSFDGEMNMNMDTRAEIVAPLVEASTTSVYVSVPASSTCEDGFAELLDQWITNV